MKFAIEYEELLKILNKEGFSRIINSFKNEENKFYIIKHSDLKVTENEKKHKKLVEKMKKKLEKKVFLIQKSLFLRMLLPLYVREIILTMLLQMIKIIWNKYLRLKMLKCYLLNIMLN